MHKDAKTLYRGKHARTLVLWDSYYRQQLESILKDRKVVITCDLWTSGGLEPLLGITCHFINNYNFESFVLSFERAPHPHSGENLRRQLINVLMEYKIEFGNVASVTCDGASNNQFNQRKLGEELLNEPIFTQHHCVLHQLNLALKA